MKNTPMDLEKYLIPVDQWQDAPPDVRRMAEEGHKEGIPVGVGWCIERGWFILHTGQGPYIAWAQR